MSTKSTYYQTHRQVKCRPAIDPAVLLLAPVWHGGLIKALKSHSSVQQDCFRNMLLETRVRN